MSGLSYKDGHQNFDIASKEGKVGLHLSYASIVPSQTQEVLLIQHTYMGSQIDVTFMESLQ